jgi:hypothetical protein
MQSVKLAKSCFEEARQAIADPFFFEKGFVREENSDVFEKNRGEYSHNIWLEADFHQRGTCGIQLLIDPVVHWRIPAIGKKVLEIIGEELFWITCRSDLVLGQSIRHFVVGNTDLGWRATSAREHEFAISSICEFMNRHVLPMLENMQSIADFIRLHETNEPKIVKQQDQYVFVAAAYLMQGRHDEASLVMEKHLCRPGLRKRYAPVFEYLSRLNK